MSELRVGKEEMHHNAASWIQKCVFKSNGDVKQIVEREKGREHEGMFC